MTVHLNLTNCKGIEGKENAKLHYMPCVIKCDGNAKVSTYFEPVIREEENGGVLKASFRGHQLLGKKLPLPQNYLGMVLEEVNTTKLSKTCERNVYEKHKFNEFTYWNWDFEPSGDDKIVLAMDWLDIAEALHSPVDSDTKKLIQYKRK